MALLAIAAGIGSYRLSRTDRLICFVTWLGSTISIFVLMFLLETYQGQLDQMTKGSPQEFNGGRYTGARQVVLLDPVQYHHLPVGS